MALKNKDFFQGISLGEGAREEGFYLVSALRGYERNCLLSETLSYGQSPTRGARTQLP